MAAEMLSKHTIYLLLSIVFVLSFRASGSAILRNALNELMHEDERVEKYRDDAFVKKLMQRDMQDMTKRGCKATDTVTRTRDDGNGRVGVLKIFTKHPQPRFVLRLPRGVDVKIHQADLAEVRGMNQIFQVRQGTRKTGGAFELRYSMSNGNP